MSHRAKRPLRSAPILQPLESRLLLAAGDLDTTFGTGGKVTTSLATKQIARDIAIDATGAIYVAADVNNSAAVLKYTPAGQLDTAFNGTGYVSAPASLAMSVATVAVQKNGRILLAGTAGTSSSSRQVVLRFLPDGSPDFSWDGDGIAYIGIAGTVLKSIALQADGKLVTAGQETDAFDFYRLNSDGSVESTFAGGVGHQRVTFAGYNTTPTLPDPPDVSGLSISLGSDGRIVAAGTIFTPPAPTYPNHLVGVVRMLANGSMDPTFDGDGKLVEAGRGLGYAYAQGITVAPDQRILVSGVEGNDGLVLRYNVNGSRDAAFGSGGMAITTIGTGGIGTVQVSQLADVTVLGDGRILVGGRWHSIDTPALGAWGIQVLDSSGKLDPAFSADGIATPFGYGKVMGLEVQADGRIVAAGPDYGSAPTNWKGISVARLMGFAATAKAGGPYTLAEGGVITLNGSATPTAGRTVTAWEWDFNYDGKSFQVDATGAAPTFAAGNADGPATRTIALRVIDSAGEPSSISTATVKFLNAAPTATLSVPASTTVGATLTARLLPSDPSAADVSAGFKYSFDWNDDGTWEATDIASSSNVAPAAFVATAGIRNLRARVKDKDGSFKDYLASIIVSAAPTAQAGGPYTVTQGASVTLNGSASVPAGRTVAAYEWDFNYDGSSFQIDATGAKPSFSAVSIAGPATRTLALRIRDSAGVLSAISTATITINPKVAADTTPPTATLLTALRLRQTGGSFYKFTVRYKDSSGINPATLLSSNILVTGPNNFSSPVRLLSTTQIDSTTWDAFYRLAAPGGSWDSSDNGLYTINVVANQVKDTAGNAFPAGPTTMPKTKNGVLIPGQTVPGQFSVVIPIAPALVRAPSSVLNRRDDLWL